MTMDDVQPIADPAAEPMPTVAPVEASVAAEPSAYAHPDETVALHETTVAAMERFCDSERVRFVRMLRDIFGG
jgi:hypothetical protein